MMRTADDDNDDDGDDDEGDGGGGGGDDETMIDRYHMSLQVRFIKVPSIRTSPSTRQSITAAALWDTDEFVQPQSEMDNMQCMTIDSTANPISPGLLPWVHDDAVSLSYTYVVTIIKHRHDDDDDDDDDDA